MLHATPFWSGDALHVYAVLGLLLAFGLGNRVGPAWGFVLSLAIFFGVQVPFSLWWTRRHERGPMENLWARLTYGRRDRGSGLKPQASAPRP